jgi:erythromycin esterase-like protein
LLCLQEEQQRIHASIQDLKTFDPSKVKASPAKGATEAKAGAAPKQQQAAQKTQQVSEDLINQAIDAATKSATGSQ